MARTKIGRNDACPCGSGKKYKRCCLRKAKAERPIAAAAPPAMAWADDDDELERITNGVIDLIQAGALTEAERECETLRRRWPGMIDWMDRLALVREAQGRYAEAAALNRQAAEFARSHAGFDPEGIKWFEDAAARQEALAAAS